LQAEKISRKKDFVWHGICSADFAERLAQDLQRPAILAENARFLPFWQLFDWLTVIIVSR
jgi:hypothetical protein